jgi:hypothetical protein
MHPDIAIAYQRLIVLGISAMRLLPNLAIALLVFLVFPFPASVVRKLVRHVNAKRYHRNLVRIGDEIAFTVNTAYPQRRLQYAIVIGNGVKIRLRPWIKPPRRADAPDLQDAALEKVKGVLTAHGIDLPFPTRPVLPHDRMEETDGDRRRQREDWPAGPGAVPRPARSMGGADNGCAGCHDG